ncbi:acyl-CoA thioesterase [Botrimarina hoheduenensis]|uniref:Acyl-CoA thioester hydrolase YbgC n=1 Tax=Botrimarina hoheduenensis TaxID=2528000 RepID=A0A5C5WDW9_9BACT|nr:thioesterase family protein [Botrimarina hoheduenensis]TWT48657.1 Acyl-CoA thioester hydrolase YbgC [Botrimarina hoheduenensis]
MPDAYEFDLAVRYYETDAQGHVHHSNFLRYFELARVEMLKARGHEYADLEADGVLLVVSRATCRYHRPARYGDTLRVLIRTERARGARIDHVYELRRNDELIAEGATTIACVDRTGKICRLPAYLELPEAE